MIDLSVHVLQLCYYCKRIGAFIGIGMLIGIGTLLD